LGDPNVRTPYLDRLADESLNFSMAISGCPVCSPARASLLTGQYPDRHGVFGENEGIALTSRKLKNGFR
jgi:arylsulfatase A-like enzyme